MPFSLIAYCLHNISFVPVPARHIDTHIKSHVQEMGVAYRAMQLSKLDMIAEDSRHKCTRSSTKSGSTYSRISVS